MLEMLTICVALLNVYTDTQPVSPIIGLWESELEDTFEFRQNGHGHDYVKAIESGLQYRWKEIDDRIEFDYPEDIPDRTCLFTINDETLTLSGCNIVTSELGYVRVWSGERVK